MSVALAGLASTFTTRTARARGLHPRELYRMRDNGDLVELSRGVFRQADAPPATLPDALAVGHRAPTAVICCISALVVHDLTDQIPASVQIAVPRSHRPPHISYPPVKVFRFANDTFELGLSAAEAAPGEEVRVYNAERTVVDLMRLRHRLGEQLALGALRRYLRRRDARPGELISLARTFGVLGPVRTAIDVASAESIARPNKTPAAAPTSTCRIELGASGEPPRSYSPSTSWSGG